ncbi:MAG TPA: hypothetical protein VNQ97_03030, partial [Burkholderiaceae bacterium]|nr:hypothetical protein [Burkholderiaceae bacterium]
MTETNENSLLASEGIADSEGDVATDDAKSTSQRGRGRKLRTPFRRRRGDAQADTPVTDQADASAEPVAAAASAAGEPAGGEQERAAAQDAAPAKKPARSPRRRKTA